MHYQTFQANHRASFEVNRMFMFSEYVIPPHGNLDHSCVEFPILDQTIGLLDLLSCFQQWLMSSGPGEKFLASIVKSL